MILDTLTSETALYREYEGLKVAYAPGPGATPLTEAAKDRMLLQFEFSGCEVVDLRDGPDFILTTAPFLRLLKWKEARVRLRKYVNEERKNRESCIYAIVHAKPREFFDFLHIRAGELAKEEPNIGLFTFPGLPDRSPAILLRQGKQRGPIMTLLRLTQLQAWNMNVLLIVGEQQVEDAYLFDLVGAHPRIPTDSHEELCLDFVTRIIVKESTEEVTDHQHLGRVKGRVVGEMTTLEEMCAASARLGKLGFFDEMVRLQDLIPHANLARLVGGSITEQYSEGCFAVWDPIAEGLVTTVTGSAVPVSKGEIEPKNLTLVVEPRSDERGVLYRGLLNNSKPSSEALEMIYMVRSVPTTMVEVPGIGEVKVPVIHWILHGHNAVDEFDARYWEHIHLKRASRFAPVSCATLDQAKLIEDVAKRSETLQNPDDPRWGVVAVISGHGSIIIGKWRPGMRAFESFLTSLDRGYIRMTNNVPQGDFRFVPVSSNRRHLVTKWVTPTEWQA